MNWPSGSVIYLRQGATPPAGFTLIGSFKQSLGGVGAKSKDGRSKDGGNTITLYIYLKQ